MNTQDPGSQGFHLDVSFQIHNGKEKKVKGTTHCFLITFDLLHPVLAKASHMAMLTFKQSGGGGGASGRGNG